MELLKKIMATMLSIFHVELIINNTVVLTHVYISEIFLTFQINILQKAEVP